MSELYKQLELNQNYTHIYKKNNTGRTDGNKFVLRGHSLSMSLIIPFYDPPLRIVTFWPTYKTLLKRCQVMHFSTLIGSLCRLGTFNTVIVAQFSSKRCND